MKNENYNFRKPYGIDGGEERKHGPPELNNARYVVCGINLVAKEKRVTLDINKINKNTWSQRKE